MSQQTRKDDDEEFDSMMETSSDDDSDESTINSSSYCSSSSCLSSSSCCSSSSCDDDDETTALTTPRSINGKQRPIAPVPRLTIRLSPDKRAALKRQREEECTTVNWQQQQYQDEATPPRLPFKQKERNENGNDSCNKRTSPKITQVQCDSCGKWHILPRFIEPKTLPDIWTCSMITWGNTNRIKKSTCPSLNNAIIHEKLPVVSTSSAPLPQCCYRMPAASSSDHNHRPWTPPFDHSDDRVQYFTQDFPLISTNVSSSPQQQLQTCENNDIESNINLKMLRFFMDNQENGNTMFFDDDEEIDTKTNSHWVRRSVRLPSRAVLSSSGLTSLIDKLKCNDVTVEVLKMKDFLPSSFTPSMALDTVLDVLEKYNSNVQAIYIQNYNEGMRDAQVLHLLRVLQKGRIWCFNLGETYRVKMKTWKIFAKGLQKTNVTHCYLSEHTITPQIKEQIRNTIRENRKKHDRHIDPKNIDVIERCTHCWWNPINAKALRPYLKDAGKEYLLSPEVQNAKPLVENSFIGCRPVEKIATHKISTNILH